MKSATNTLIFIGLVFSGFFSQSNTQSLKKQQKKIERKISNTKNLLKKVTNSKKESFGELQLINNQIESREALLRLYDRQVVMAEGTIRQKQEEIDALKERVKKLKDQYKDMILHAYKSRSKNGQMMFVLSAENYYEAQKRNKYLKSITALHKKQAAIIATNQNKIKAEIEAIEIEKEKKKSLLSQKRFEREEIESDREKKLAVLAKIKQKESSLLSEIKSNQIKRQELKAKIAEAIKRELAEIERKRKAAERKRREKNTVGENAFSFKDESSEGKIISKNFEKNKGTLPWPVESGAITEGFGKNKHPSLKDVYTNNNGIDISCSPGSPIRAIFSGEVTAVFPIPGAGKVIILKHGNYRTVYSNLQESFVSIGDEVSTRTEIGNVLTTENSLATLHFEVHLVTGMTTTSLNPSLWIDR
tara:strand:- start:13010 stop:14263 length:1254 start_codon:yes stop_codon:yes gene_type:complete